MSRKKKIEEVCRALPQRDCGGCGYETCRDYARAVVEGGAPLSLCGSGGFSLSRRLNRIIKPERYENHRIFRPQHAPGGSGITGESRREGNPRRDRGSIGSRYREIAILRARVGFKQSRLHHVKLEIERTTGRG